MQKFTYLLLTLATLLFAEHLMAQEIEYPSNKPILSDEGQPSYWRRREKNGIGIGISWMPDPDREGRYAWFYDRGINSNFGIHFFVEETINDEVDRTVNSAENLLYRSDNYGGACNFDGGSRPVQYCPDVESLSYQSRYTMFGVSLRNFPFNKFGFFWGVGSGLIYYRQDFFLHWDPSWPSNLSTIYYKGIPYFGEIGWQGYDGFYLTINTLIGNTIIIEENNNPNNKWEFTEKGRNWLMSQYESHQSHRQLSLGVGWHL